ncbi:MAG: MarR family transcriptional regulator [Gemmatimonas sp.]|nr:MarR family transcriptional regulator [Gemmatimonas sp.]
MTSPLVLMLLETAKALQDRLEEALKDVGLSRAKMEALQQLVRAGEPMPLRALAEGQRCVPSNMTTLIDRLESEGLVRRVDDPADRRSVRAELTPLGAERAAAGAEVLVRVQEEFASSLPLSEQASLRRILASLHPE